MGTLGNCNERSNSWMRLSRVRPAATARERRIMRSKGSTSVACGVHTGACEEMGDKLTGIAVHIGARVAALAAADEALV